MQWEYRVVMGDAALSQLGQDGWELVAVLPGDKTTLYFKRPTQGFRDRVTNEQKRAYYEKSGIGLPEGMKG